MTPGGIVNLPMYVVHSVTGVDTAASVPTNAFVPMAPKRILDADMFPFQSAEVFMSTDNRKTCPGKHGIYVPP